MIVYDYSKRLIFVAINSCSEIQEFLKEPAVLQHVKSSCYCSLELMMVNKINPLEPDVGLNIPSIGFGTMLFPEPEKAVDLISYAIDVGYRHIDTARKYGSEAWVGEALANASVKREDIWVTTKVTEENAKADDFASSVELSLRTLKLDYVDLLLIHWPQPNVPLQETINALIKAKRDGLAKNIGISNFTVELIHEAVKLSSEPLYTNQVEYHPYINQDKVLTACRQYGISVTCHVPLARGKVLTDPVISKIGKFHNKSPAQITLRWLIQQENIIAVPRGLSKQEIIENINVYDFTLSNKEMDEISSLRKKNLRLVDPEVRRPLWDIP